MSFDQIAQLVLGRNNNSSVNNIAALPEENAKTFLANPSPRNSEYKLIPIALTPPREIPIFDRYSPRLANFMTRDAIQNSKQLFSEFC